MNPQDDLKSSRGFDVPNVFVVPPEEDDIPRWCCFDAALPIDQQISIIEECEQETNIFDPTSSDEDFAATSAAIARRDMQNRSIARTLMTRECNFDHVALDSDSDMEWDSDNDYQHRSRPPREPESPNRSLSDVGNDSDVIEVVRVSRKRRDMGDLEYRVPSSQAMGRSGTFKARATKALRSFTGTFRKPKTQDILPPRPASSMSWQRPQEQTKSKLSRSGSQLSRRVSQMFNPATTPIPVSSSASISSADGEASAPTIPSQPTTSSVHRANTFYATGPRRPSIYRSTVETQADNTLPRGTGPYRSTSTKSTTRFSKLNLSRMFSFSHSQANLAEEDLPTSPTSMTSGRTTPPPPPPLKRKSSSLPSTSASSESSGPQTPTTDEGPVRSMTNRSMIVYDEEGQSPQLDFGEFDAAGLDFLPLSLSTSSSQSDSFNSRSVRPSGSCSSSKFFSTAPSHSNSSQRFAGPRKPAPEVEDPGDGDVSFEMKLDSLHFDDLSFDAEGFRVELNN